MALPDTTAARARPTKAASGDLVAVRCCAVRFVDLPEKQSSRREVGSHCGGRGRGGVVVGAVAPTAAELRLGVPGVVSAA